MFVWIGWRLMIWAVLLVISGLLVILVPAVAPWAVMLVLCGAIRPWLGAWKNARGNGVAGGFGLGGADDRTRFARSGGGVTRASGDRSAVDGADHVSYGLDDSCVLDVGAGSQKSWEHSVGDLDGASGGGVPDSLAGSGRPPAAGAGVGASSARFALDVVLRAAGSGRSDEFLAHPIRPGGVGAGCRSGPGAHRADAHGLDGRDSLRGLVGRGLVAGPRAGGLGSGRIVGRSRGETLWNGSGSGSGTTGESSGRCGSRSGSIALPSFPSWPWRLTWFGLVPASPATGVRLWSHPEQAEATLRGLIRRFVAPERVDVLLNTSEGDLAIRQGQHDDRGSIHPRTARGLEVRSTGGSPWIDRESTQPRRR